MAGMHDSPAISPDHKDAAGGTIASLPKVILREDFALDKAQGASASELSNAVRAQVNAAHADHVVYLELAVNLQEAAAAAGLEPREALDAVTAGLDVDGIDARVLVAAHRGPGGQNPEQALELARLTAEARERNAALVAGFALLDGGGDYDAEGDGVADLRPLGDYAATLEALRAGWTPVVIAVGRGDSADIAEAVQLGATRLAHATGMIDDFTADIAGINPGKVSGWVRDRHLAVDTAPLWEVARGDAPELKDHILPLLQQLGFTCTVGTGAPADGTATEAFFALQETFGYGLEEFFDLTVKAVENSFMNQEERQQVLDTEILPAYEELSEAEYNEDAAVPDTAADAAAASGSDEAGDDLS